MSTPSAAFDPERFDRTAAATVPGYAALQELVAVAVAARVAPSARVLDLGCGTGAGVLALARALPSATLVGCDPALPMITAAGARFAAAGINVRVVHGGVESLGDEAPFDAVVCTLVMHFIPVTQRLDWLRAIRHRLAPGGALVLSVITRSEAADDNDSWSMIRSNYAKANGISADVLARAQAPDVTPVIARELDVQLREAGFGSASPLYQFLAVRCWLVDGGLR